jgi:hypothetical protein
MKINLLQGSLVTIVTHLNNTPAHQSPADLMKILFLNHLPNLG